MLSRFLIGLGLAGVTPVVAFAAITSTDATNASFISNALGIGTASPNAALDVATTGTARSALLIPRDTSANRPSAPVNGMLRYNTNLNSAEVFANGSWMAFAGAFGSTPWTVNGSTIYYSSGNVGVGNSGPSYPLDVTGTIRANNGFLTVTSNGSTPTSNYGTLYYRTRGTSASPTAVQVGDYIATESYYAYDGSAYQLGAATSALVDNTVSAGTTPTALTFSTGSERMRIASSGRVGIATSNPAATLDVAGVLNVNASASPALSVSGIVPVFQVNEGTGVAASIVRSTADPYGANIMFQKTRSTTPSGLTAVQSGDSLGQLVWDATDGSALQSPAYISARINGTVGSGAVPADLIFATGSNSNPAERMRITSTGNVGIGTTNPGNVLEVNGNITAHADAGGQGFRVLGRSSDNFSWGPLVLSNTGTSYVGGIGFNPAAASINMGSALTEVMRWTSGGSVGIGTQSPAYRTHIYAGDWDGLQLSATGTGSAAFRFSPMGAYNTGYRTLVVGTDDNHDVTLRTGGMYRLYVTSGGYVGIGTTAPSYPLHVIGQAGLSTGTAWTNTSDARLKNVHGAYGRGLDDVLKLRPVRYAYREGNPLNLPSNFEKTGFVAQDVQRAIPEAVTEGSHGYLELNVDPIHWAVVNAIRQLHERWREGQRLIEHDLEAKDARIRVLEADGLQKTAEIENLRARLDRLERLLLRK